MDIGSKQGYPSSSLSNFSPHPFKMGEMECASMEGFLQGLKFDKPHIQNEVCKLVGLAAKRRGSKRNKAWKQKQMLWYKGLGLDRDGVPYQRLLDGAYKALYEQNENFRKALHATENAVLTHSMGRRKTNETVLTEQEFCSRLMKLRDGLL